MAQFLLPDANHDMSMKKFSPAMSRFLFSNFKYSKLINHFIGNVKHDNTSLSIIL